MNSRPYVKLFLLALTFLLFAAPEAQSQKLCIKKRLAIKNTRVPLGSRALRVLDECPRAFREVLDVNTLRSSSPFGDGSAGDIVISTDKAFDYSNTQFRSLTINDGVTVQVPSGTIIRVQEDFINNGNIVVSFGASGAPGAAVIADSAGYLPTAHQGIGFRAAMSGEVGDQLENRRGGRGGIPAGFDDEFNVLFASRAYYGRAPAGSGGSAATYTGSAAGGALYVYAGGSIVVSGLVAANGENAADEFVPCVGGGAGGLIVLAARGSTTLTGSANILVRGGDGGESTEDCGAGGGGSGGIVALYGSSVTNDATVNRSGGAAGFSGTAVTNAPRSGGGGGGALAGYGGEGATIGPAPGNPEVISAKVGENGRVMTFTFDPSSVLF